MRQSFALHPVVPEHAAARIAEQLHGARASFREHQVAGDGNCMYRAVTCHVFRYGHNGHLRLRRKATEVAWRHREDFLPFFCDGNAEELFSAWTDRMSRPGAWCEDACERAVCLAIRQVDRPLASSSMRRGQEGSVTLILSWKRRSQHTVVGHWQIHASSSAMPDSKNILGILRVSSTRISRRQSRSRGSSCSTAAAAYTVSSKITTTSMGCHSPQDSSICYERSRRRAS